jgi:hypothetical protein
MSTSLEQDLVEKQIGEYLRYKRKEAVARAVTTDVRAEYEKLDFLKQGAPDFSKDVANILDLNNKLAVNHRHSVYC